MEEVKLVFMAGNYCSLWILCVWNGGYGDGAAELAGDVITELLFTVQFQHINECKSPLIGVLLAWQVVRIATEPCREMGRDYQGEGLEKAKNTERSVRSPRISSCSPVARPLSFLFTFCEELDNRVQSRNPPPVSASRCVPLIVKQPSPVTRNESDVVEQQAHRHYHHLQPRVINTGG